MRVLLSVLLLATAFLMPGRAQADCWDSYRKTTFTAHRGEFPLMDFQRWSNFAYTEAGEMKFAVLLRDRAPVQGITVSVPLRYSGEFRPIGPVAKEALRVFGGDAVARIFASELHVVDHEFDGWILVQDALLPHLHQELRKGDSFTACLALIGRSATQHLYVLNEFAVINAPNLPAPSGKRVVPAR